MPTVKRYVQKFLPESTITRTNGEVKIDVILIIQIQSVDFLSSNNNCSIIIYHHIYYWGYIHVVRLHKPTRSIVHNRKSIPHWS